MSYDMAAYICITLGVLAGYVQGRISGYRRCLKDNTVITYLPNYRDDERGIVFENNRIISFRQPEPPPSQ